MVDHLVAPWFDTAFPFFFIGLWLAITTLLGLAAGWFRLQRRYPDNGETASSIARGQSGSMGLGVSLSGVLTLAACRSGLRIKIWRAFGLFQRPFLVPWDEITVEQGTRFFVPTVRLRFGRPQVGKLTIAAVTWQRLTAAQSEIVAIPRTQTVSKARVARGLALQWLATTTIVGTFVYCALHSDPRAPHIPLILCYGMPAIMLGLGQLVRFLFEA